MKYSQIRKQDVSNGDGIGIALFVQGCSFHCKNCFNSSTWDFDRGNEWSKETEDELISLGNRPYISRLSILGGEPLHPNNVETVTEIVKRFKETYPNKKIWLWTGYSFSYVKNLDIIKYLDYIIDGKFVDELRDLKLKYRGSSNQNVYKNIDGEWKQIVL